MKSQQKKTAQIKKTLESTEKLLEETQIKKMLEST